jgi:DNA-binding response OmpR family regulator
MTRILVVDDDPSVRSVVKDALQQDGYQVDTVSTGRQVLAAFARHRPALLVLDLAMPEMDGPRLVRTLRDQTRWGRVPLVVLSGIPQAPEVGARLGARACVRKPFDLQELLATVEQVAPPD